MAAGTPYAVRVLATKVRASDGAPSTEHTATPLAGIDYDTDDDGLIEIATLAQLNAVRWDLNGNGWPDRSSNASVYLNAFPGAEAEMGCTPSCSGYELGASAASSVALAFTGSEDFAEDGNGWLPIGSSAQRFGATFQGNGHVIRQLAIRRSATDDVGLFGAIGSTARIEGVRLVDVDVTGGGDVGGLVGDSLGTVVASHAAGAVRGDSYVGGLIGRHGGIIRTSSAVGEVSGRTSAGGLVGIATSPSAIAASYAVSRVQSREVGGGLVGYLSGSLTASYASSEVDASFAAGGLVGYASGGTISASYANGGLAAELRSAGGLVGVAGTGAATTPTITDSYWDVDAAGYNTSAGGTGKSAEQLRTVTSATGTYANWDGLTVDAVGAADDAPWDFGTASQYPVLNFGALTAAAQRPAIASTAPASLDEGNLTGATLEVTLPAGYSFNAFVSTSDFELLGAPPGVTISGARRQSATLAQLTLATGDFDEAWSLGVRVGGAAVGGSVSRTTAAVPVGATAEVPAALDGLTVAVLWARLDVSWSPAAEANLYRVQWKHGSQAYSDERSAETTDTSYSIRELPSLAHTVKVTPLATQGVAGTAAEATATPMGIHISSTAPSPLTEDALARTATVTVAIQGRNGIFRQHFARFELQPAGLEIARMTVLEGLKSAELAVTLGENTDFDEDTTLRVQYGTFSLMYTQEVPLLATVETAPAQATGLAATPGERLLELSWNAASDATHYKVQWRDGAQEWGSTGAGAGEVVVSATSTTISDLAAFTAYTVRVVALRARGPDGPPSEEHTATPLAGGDFDSDDDGLIEIATLDQLNAVRWDLNGDGTTDSSADAAAYATAFKYRRSDMGCPSGCRGYELGTSATSSVVLDFSGASSYRNGGAGWLPIGGANAFGATFQGNGHAIRNLAIARTTSDNVGLFAALGSSARVAGVRLLGVDVRGDENVGALAGDNAGTVVDCQASGSIQGSVNAGGLAGVNRGAILTSFATGSASATSSVGGLAGFNAPSAVVAASYSASDVSGVERVGGLVGRQAGSLKATYASGTVGGTTAVGGLVGEAEGTVASSYARGAVSGTSLVGGLIGKASGTLAVADSYWDQQTTGQSSSAGGGLGKTSHRLREHQGAVDIFAAWDDLTIDATGAGDDDPWHFGTAAQYPVLAFGSLAQTAQRALVAATMPAPLAEPTLAGATVPRRPAAGSYLSRIHQQRRFRLGGSLRRRSRGNPTAGVAHRGRTHAGPGGGFRRRLDAKRNRQGDRPHGLRRPDHGAGSGNGHRRGLGLAGRRLARLRPGRGRGKNLHGGVAQPADGPRHRRHQRQPFRGCRAARSAGVFRLDLEHPADGGGEMPRGRRRLGRQRDIDP